MGFSTLAFDPGTPIARPRHTVILVGIFLVGAITGAAMGSASTVGAPRSHVSLYASLLALEWGLVWFVAQGVRKSGTRIRDLVGGRWASPLDVLRDATLAAAVWALWTGVTLTRSHWSPGDPNRSVQPLLPTGPLEILLWIALSISAGFAEELAFRGYLQRQGRAFTGSLALAIVSQALVFGIAHGYQGAEACARIVVYGVLFGGLAAWRHSLRPGMLAHAWTDIAAGVLRI